MAARTVHKTCNLCEAMCGLRLQVDGSRVLRTEGDPDDPISRGHLCPKAMALGEIQDDPDRLRRPLRRSRSSRAGSGSDSWDEIGWDEALDETAAQIARIQKRDGNDGIGVYLGNPGAHSLGILLGLSPFYQVLDTRNRYSASSLDQNPKHASSLLLFGNFLTIPVPDLDRTDFLLMIGANPVVSNGSLMSAPGIRKRLRALRERGGHFVVVDPRRTETAKLADEHWFIRPGRDALLLAALVHTVLEEKLGRSSPADARCVQRDALVEAVAPHAPESVEARLGIPAADVRDLARRFAAADSAVCYARVGTCQHPFGTLNSWLVDVLNLVTGNLDRPGGAMFPTPAADLADLVAWRGDPGHMAKWKTRVRGAPCFNGEAPTPCLAEEIATPGPGQIRGMLTIAGNPVLSSPNGAALSRAFESLEFYAAIDFYRNETTRHADLILPPTWSLEHDNYEVLFHGFAVRNTARYSPTVIAPGPEQRDDWQILTGLALRVAERKQTGWRRTALRGVRRSGLVPTPRRILGWMLRAGPHGDQFRPWRRGLRLADLEAAPSGVDLGPLEPRLDRLRTVDRIDLAPAEIRAELTRLRADPDDAPVSGLVLIGRRDARTNNSWLHNTPVCTGGRERCTLQMHPDDAAARGLTSAERVRIESRVGSVEAPLELSSDLMPGVVSLPHGWGHRGPGLRMRLAEAHAGVSCNDLVDDAVLEPVVGNAVLNGVPVEVTAVGRADSDEDPTGGQSTGRTPT